MSETAANDQMYKARRFDGTVKQAHHAAEEVQEAQQCSPEAPAAVGDLKGDPVRLGAKQPYVLSGRYR